MKPSAALEHRGAFVTALRNYIRSGKAPAEHRYVAQVAAVAPVYFVASDMTQLATAAGTTLPVAQLTRQITPTATGFMLFDGRIGTLIDAEGATAVRGVVWADTGEESVELYPLIEFSGYLITTTQWLLWRTGQDDPVGYAKEHDHADVGQYDGETIVRTVLASWVLMQQEIAWTERTQPDRATRKRLKKAGQLSPIVIVRLRKLVRAAEENEGSELVQWQHRWLVNGHWRQQWYPSAHEHRPLWITPYVKGPEGKPFLRKDRVIAWVR